MRYRPIPKRILTGYSRCEERNGCVPVSTAILTGKPLWKTLDAWRWFGRHPRQRVNAASALGLASTMLDHRFTRVGGPARISLGRWVAENPEGRFLVLTRNHAIAVVDGIVYDWLPGGERRRVLCWYRVEKLLLTPPPRSA